MSSSLTEAQKKWLALSRNCKVPTHPFAMALLYVTDQEKRQAILAELSACPKCGANRHLPSYLASLGG